MPLADDVLTAASMQQTLLEYQAILENASIGILFTRERRVLHCNPKYSAIFGWPHGELVGQAGAVFYPSDEDYAEMGRIATPILASGQLLDRELRMRRKDGSLFDCHMRAKAINPRNTAEGTIWIAEDVGERKRAQAAMQELLLRQQAILENASVGILFTRNGLFVHCNPRAEALYGWAPGTLTGQRTSVIFSNDQDYARFGDLVRPKLVAGELVDVEWRNTRQDGSQFWCRNLARALPSADGSQSTIWITEDISDQKAAAQALATAHSQLEQRVLERTEQLAQANAQLRLEVAERKEIEKHLRASETRFRDLSALSSDWFWEQDADFRFIDVTLGQRPSNLPPVLMVGKTRWELPILGLTPAQWQEHRQTLQAHLPFDNLTYQVRNERDELRWFTVSGKPLFEQGVFVGYRGIGSDITARKLIEEKIEFLAYHDPLTGLPNRLLLQDRMQQAMAHADRTQTRLALVFMDLDNFKHINDSLGHATGDALLKETASRVGQCIRNTDTLSRQGGDEFVLLLADLPDPDSALPVLAKISAHLQDSFVIDGNELSTSASMGVVIYPDDGADFETLSKKADTAMYKAKEAGRNTYRFFDEAMNIEAVDHLVMRNGLRRALDEGEFVLHYQPQIDLASGAVTGAEALLRWQHPEQGLVLPARFIPIAEDSGLIVPIGEWVIHEACRQAMAWRAAGLPALVVAVNLSAVQIRRGSVEHTVRHALQQSGLDPALLELELTETILIQNVEQVLASVKRLKQLGIKLSIDDFGTGYSSLSYLKRFDIDKLKIDQSFIRDLAIDPDDAAIVRAIIQMAHSLNLKTLAEGVENAAMLQHLRSFGCDEAQGFLFSHPMPAATFAVFLQKNMAHPQAMRSGYPPL